MLSGTRECDMGLGWEQSNREKRLLVNQRVPRDVSALCCTREEAGTSSNSGCVVAG
jgi:hypothetical protein